MPNEKSILGLAFPLTVILAVIAGAGVAFEIYAISITAAIIAIGWPLWMIASGLVDNS